MRILVCNDDGITAPGIRALVEVAQEFGEVVVVAPDKPQSGMGHAISIGVPLRLYPSREFGDIPAWACSGTPADCVKLATGILGEKPDLLLSGINHGANFSISVFYSGTLSAAIEGAFEGIPSMGISLLDYSREADFSAAQAIVRELMLLVQAHPFPAHVPLNVNIPKLPLSEIKGLRLTRQAKGRFIEQFEERIDPYGQPYYWMVGRFESQDAGPDTDLWALERGYVSVCPLNIDLTAYEQLKHWAVLER